MGWVNRIASQSQADPPSAKVAPVAWYGRITSPVSFGAKLKRWLVALVNRCLVLAIGTLSGLG